MIMNCLKKCKYTLIVQEKINITLKNNFFLEKTMMVPELTFTFYNDSSPSSKNFNNY